MQKLKLIGLPLLFFAFAVSAQKTDILVSTDWLKAHLNDNNLVIFHIGMDHAYEAEHIPGAVYINSHEYTVDDDTHIFDFPTDEALKNLLESKGVSSTSNIVIYTAENWVPLVTRLYVTLDYLGYASQAHILDGGLLTWKAAGGEVTKLVPAPKKGNFAIKPNPAIRADKAYVLKSVSDPKNDIVDCRASVFYTGIEATEPKPFPTRACMKKTTLVLTSSNHYLTWRPFSKPRDCRKTGSWCSTAT
jgi:thiosulfate/3-mercaptopyruvate sulfurtransferase